MCIEKIYEVPGFSLIVAVVLVLSIMIGTNACTKQDWNEGACPDCEIRYELRGASKGLKYYACPECGKEVQRY